MQMQQDDEGFHGLYNRQQEQVQDNDDDAQQQQHQIQLPSYVSSPSSPQSPYSPRAMAIQQLKRAASQRSQRGANNNNDNSSLTSSISSGNAATAANSAPLSPSTTGMMSPSMSRAPSIKRIGLERSASDAARRMAMAKLTGEKVTAPPEFTMPHPPLPSGPLPTLADLQARHEQRFGLTSPEPALSSASNSPPQGLSRNPSSASTSLSRQLSTASNRNNGAAHNLSRNPSLARSFGNGGTQFPLQSTSEEHATTLDTSTNEDEAGSSDQRRIDERQEARSNLIRKLSRGRLAGAVAAANLRDRHAADSATGSERASPPHQMEDSNISAHSSANMPLSSPSSAATSTNLQRRPSLADMLARAEARNAARSQTPETPSRLPHLPLQGGASTPPPQRGISPSASFEGAGSSTASPSTSSNVYASGHSAHTDPIAFSPQSELLSPPTALSSANLSPGFLSRLNAMSPDQSTASSSPSSFTIPMGIALQKPPSLRKTLSKKGQYDHIPVPPTPETARTHSSHNSHSSNSIQGFPLSAASTSTTDTHVHSFRSGGPATHESVYSAVSNFRPYRHTMERDRDSAIARMQMEDNFELELIAQQARGRETMLQSGTLASANSALHEKHPLSDDEEEDEDRSQLQQEHGSSHIRHHPSPAEGDPTLKQGDFIPAPTGHITSPSQTAMQSRQSPSPAGNAQFLSAAPTTTSRRPSNASSTLTVQTRSAGGSMPHTPSTVSAMSPFSYSPAAASPLVSDPGQDYESSSNAADETHRTEEKQTQMQKQAHMEAHAPNVQTGVHASSREVMDENSENQYSFRRHHQKESTDSFPVSVLSSGTSRYPSVMTSKGFNQPPLPEHVSPPAALRSIMKDKDASPSSSRHGSPRGKALALPEKIGISASAEKQRHEQDAKEELAYKFGNGTPSSARAAYRSAEEVDNAGPTSEYRFPTASSRGRRPDSIASSNDHHDESLNNMINRLEAMQAGSDDSHTSNATSTSTTNKAFGARGGLPRRLPQQTFPSAPTQVSPLQQARSGLPEAASFHITGLASQLRQPALRAHGSPRLEERQLPPTHPGLQMHVKQTSLESNGPGQDGSPRSPRANRGDVREAHQKSEIDTFHFSHDVPPYKSSGSAENDSAPSLARSGTGSSSSGLSTQSDSLASRPPPPENKSKEEVMARLSKLLATQGQETRKSNALDSPPRRLLLHASVLQVVNANTVKDRYLFLFNDLLVITKPLIDEDGHGDPIPPSLNTKFIVKSIVELPKLKLTAQATESGEDPVQKRKHPLLLTFVDRFSNDPKKAVNALISKAGLSSDAATIANLLFRNPELNKSQLGAYLAHKEQKPILKAYCDRFRLAGIRVEDALRVFIGSLRLPNDYGAAEYMLSVFASQWLASNPATGMTNDGVFATKLVISIMELNDALHSGIDDEAAAAGSLFSFPNSAITVDDFIAAFRLKDPHGALPDEHLTRIYLSIRKDRLQQAADNAIFGGIPEIDVTIHPSKLPNRLIYRMASENISLTIPRIDPKFAIKLVGQDLRFEPPVLTFARSRTATFRVTATALGSKAMLFIRLGPNAHLYRNLPINKTFSVERAFMNHTFQIAFVNHLNVKRKYLFSLTSSDAKFTWVDTLRERIENSPVEQADTPRPARLSETISLQVLRDALIAPDEPAPVLANKLPVLGMRTGFNTPPGSRGRSAAAAGGGALQRSSSISRTYAHGQGRAEADLEARRPSNTNLSILTSLTSTNARRASRDDSAQQHKTGNDIVAAVRQNSLLPLVLGFLGAGVEGVDALPRKPVHPAKTESHVSPAQPRGTGRFKDL